MRTGERLVRIARVSKKIGRGERANRAHDSRFLCHCLRPPGGASWRSHAKPDLAEGAPQSPKRVNPAACGESTKGPEDPPSAWFFGSDGMSNARHEHVDFATPPHRGKRQISLGERSHQAHVPRPQTWPLSPNCRRACACVASERPMLGHTDIRFARACVPARKMACAVPRPAF